MRFILVRHDEDGDTVHWDRNDSPVDGAYRGSYVRSEWLFPQPGARHVNTAELDESDHSPA